MPAAVAGGAQDPLRNHTGDLAGAAALLLYLSGAGSARLTTSQAAFFLLAAAAHLRGHPATLARLGEAVSEPGFRPSVKNTYRQLLEPSHAFPNGLSWLKSETSPTNLREKVLTLTPTGRNVIQGALLALKPFEGAKENGPES
jgi:hypothetical protein